MSSSTRGLRVLVIEDEAMVAFFIEDMLTEMGHEVGAVASRMQQALDIARTGTFDLAIVDVNLDGQPSYPIAEVLRERRNSFRFCDGLWRERVGCPIRWHTDPRKAFRHGRSPEAAARVLERLIACLWERVVYIQAGSRLDLRLVQDIAYANSQLFECKRLGDELHTGIEAAMMNNGIARIACSKKNLHFRPQFERRIR